MDEQIRAIIEGRAGPSALAGSLPETASLAANARFRRELVDVVTECSQADWDADGALPLRSEAIAGVERFAAMMSGDFGIPEVVPEPDGDLALEWHAATDRWLIVSFRSAEAVHYAAKFPGGGRSEGKIAITSRELGLIRDLLKLVAAAP